MDRMEQPGRTGRSTSHPMIDGGVLTGKTVAFVIAPEGAEESETLRPWEAVMAAGGRASFVCPEGERAQLFDHFDRGQRVPVDQHLAEAAAADYDVLPGIGRGYPLGSRTWARFRVRDVSRRFGRASVAA